MIWKSIKFHLFSEDSFPRDFYLQAYSLLCCANDLNHFLFLIKAPNILPPGSLYSFPRVKGTEPAPACVPQGHHAQAAQAAVHLATCIVPTANTWRKPQEGAAGEREEKRGRKNSPKHKRKPPHPKSRLESCA